MTRLQGSAERNLVARQPGSPTAQRGLVRLSVLFSCSVARETDLGLIVAPCRSRRKHWHGTDGFLMKAKAYFTETLLGKQAGGGPRGHPCPSGETYAEKQWMGVFGTRAGGADTKPLRLNNKATVEENNHDLVVLLLFLCSLLLSFISTICLW